MPVRSQAQIPVRWQGQDQRNCNTFRRHHTCPPNQRPRGFANPANRKPPLLSQKAYNKPLYVTLSEAKGLFRSHSGEILHCVQNDNNDTQKARPNVLDANCLLRTLPPCLFLLDFFYFLATVIPSAIDAGAFLGCLIPGIRAYQIARPKRPASALVWPNRVDYTFSLAANILQEYAISGEMVFNNRGS
jgi:hypothetical protein